MSATAREYHVDETCADYSDAELAVVADFPRRATDAGQAAGKALRPGRRCGREGVAAGKALA